MGVHYRTKGARMTMITEALHVRAARKKHSGPEASVAGLLAALRPADASGTPTALGFRLRDILSPNPARFLDGQRQPYGE
jgi:plasmid stability protein